MPCWRFFWRPSDPNGHWDHYACGDNPSFLIDQTSGYRYPALNGNFITRGGAPIEWGPEVGFERIWNAERKNTGAFITGNCFACNEPPPPPPPSARYDCVNGSCLEEGRYSTPGIYESLSECEKNCGPGCGGVCISNADWAKISSLAAMVKNKDCR